MKKYWSQFSCGCIEFELPVDCIESCSHQGECYDDCEMWQARLNLNLDRTDMIKELEGYGAWGVDELKAMTNVELEIKCIWIACGDISDDENYKGGII